MILGIGNDLIDIRRIEKALEKNAVRFENRVFTKAEQKKAHSRKNAGEKTVAATYAKRYAAKEACVKALGDKTGISWLDMEVVNGTDGAPTLRLHGAAEKRLKAITPQGKKAIIFLSLSDEYPLALAQVIISAD